jgi:putative flippase GtrA
MSAPIPAGPAGLRPDPLLRSPRLRPLRFALTGGLAAVLQLALLRGLEALGTWPIVANGLGFLVATQANFLLSHLFTWADRPPDALGDTLPRRWARYHAAIGGTAILNMFVFATARAAAPDLLASALGIGVAGVANFLLADQLVFQTPARSHERAVNV